VGTRDFRQEHMTILHEPLAELTRLSDNLRAVGERWLRNSPVSGASWYNDPGSWKALSSSFQSAAYHCGNLTQFLRSDYRSKERDEEIRDSLDTVERDLKDMSSAYAKLKLEEFSNIPLQNRDIFERYSVDFIDLISEYLLKYRKYCGLSIQSEQQLVGDSVEGRLARLEEFAIEHAGQGVADFARRLFPELHKQYSATREAPMEMPAVAPELWTGARGNPETPVDFIRRAYRPWLGNGLTRAHIRDLDPSLSTALDNWLRKNDMPGDLDLPTVSEALTRRLAELQADPEKPTTMTLSEARRLVDTERRRAYRENS